MRLDVSFPSSNGQCAAWLYLPSDDTTAPIVVMAHGIGGIKAMRLDAYADRFRQASFACLVFVYRGFEDSSGERRQALDIGMQLQDWKSAIDFASTLSEVDATKLAVWGTSFGGGHAITTAASNP